MGRGRARWGALAVATLAALSVLGGCGSGGDGEQMVERELSGEADDPVGIDEIDETTSTTDGETLEWSTYESGDCVMWDIALTEGSASAPLRTDVVRCTEPHRIQISEEVPSPQSETYPTVEEWDAHGTSVCSARAEFLLGAPLDPYGRFSPDWIFPLEETWNDGVRTMWCGLGAFGETADPASLLYEDARGADQWYRYQPGQCVAFPPVAQAETAVACDQPHQEEITGTVEYADAGPLPPTSEADVRCQDTVVAYYGGRPPEPWGSGSEPVPPESWAAGKRFAHCFIGQWAPDGTMIAVTGSVLGGG